MKAKILLHIRTNIKAYIRILATLLFTSILFLKLWGVYDLLCFSIMFLMLIFDLMKRNSPKTSFEALSYYLFWIMVFFCIILSLKIRYNYFDYEHNLPFFHFPIKEVFIIKLIVFGVSFIKHRSVIVTKTFLSKLWLVTIFLHFTSLFLSSTYGFETLFYSLAIISAIETILIIFTEKKLLIYKPTILDFLWKKKWI